MKGVAVMHPRGHMDRSRMSKCYPTSAHVDFFFWGGGGENRALRALDNVQISLAEISVNVVIRANIVKNLSL